MECANTTTRPAGLRASVSADAGAATILLRQAHLSHLHADWHLPSDWLTTPNCIVLARPSGELDGLFVAAPEPPPAAWVRLAAVRYRDAAADFLAGAVAALRPVLREQGVTQLAWLVADNWSEPYLPQLGFREVNAIETYVKWESVVPEAGRSDVLIRPVTDADMAALVDIEARAFAPLWRHSAASLRAGRGHAVSFDVAEVDGHVAGFQYSVRNDAQSVHLVRMTVDPLWQGRGIGRTLLAHLLHAHRRLGYTVTSLNTQIDNVASQKLYRRFGFAATGQRYPIWSHLIP